MTPQQLKQRLAACNLLPFHQIHLTRCANLMLAGLAVHQKTTDYLTLASMGASPELDAAQDALTTARGVLDDLLVDLGGIDEAAAVAQPNA